MGVISVLALCALLFALLLALLSHTHLSKHKKFALSVCCLLGIIIMGRHNVIQAQHTNITSTLEEAFYKGETLNCEGFLVNHDDFTLVKNSYTLIGKSNTPTSNIIISLAKCTIITPSTEDHDLHDAPLENHSHENYTIEELNRE